MNGIMTNKETEEYREEMLLNEASKKTLHTNKAVKHLEVLYQHTSKYIIDPSKRSSSWPARINDEYVKTAQELEKAAQNMNGKRDPMKKLLDDINRFNKDDIVYNGAKLADHEVEEGNTVNKKEFYEGDVPKFFDVRELFPDEDKFIDSVIKAAKLHDIQDNRRSRDGEKAFDALRSFKNGGSHEDRNFTHSKR